MLTVTLRALSSPRFLKNILPPPSVADNDERRGSSVTSLEFDPSMCSYSPMSRINASEYSVQTGSNNYSDGYPLPAGEEFERLGVVACPFFDFLERYP
jgi:hypothetical protein